MDTPEHASRRRLLQVAGLAALGTGTAGLAPAAAAAAASAGGAAPLPDLDDPGQHLRTYVRMRGSTDDRLVVEQTEGFVYALLPTGKPRLLFVSRGLQISRYQPVSPRAWRCRTRYFGAFADPASGALLTRWDNPLNGRRCEIETTSYGPYDVVITPRGTLPDPTSEAIEREAAAPGVRRWGRIGDLVTITDELGPPNDGKSPPDLDMVTISARVADIVDAAQADVPSVAAFGAVEPWRKWMQMGSSPGLLMWHLQSAKVRGGLDQVPGTLLRAAEARWGGLRLEGP